MKPTPFRGTERKEQFSAALFRCGCATANNLRGAPASAFFVSATVAR